MLPAIIGPKSSFQKWIGIAPFAAHKGKIYPPQLMEQVIAQLIQKQPNARIFLFGQGELEEEYFKQWCDQYQQCLYVGKMLSMDSANMHLASLTAIPVVSIWGATHPMAGFLGYHQSQENAIQVDLDCRPCSIFGNKPCKRGDYACLNNIPPERIVERITSIINN